MSSGSGGGGAGMSVGVGPPGDETYLERFVEGLATLPHDLRRSAELLRDLGGRAARGRERLERAQNQFLERAERRLLASGGRLQVVELLPDSEDETGGGDEQEQEKPAADKEPPSPTPRKKRKRKYGVRLAQETDPDDGDDDDKGATTLRVFEQAVIPTTDELMAYILQDGDGDDGDDKDTAPPLWQLYRQIRQLQRSCGETGAEAVAVARQAAERVDAQVGRLDQDLRALERLLQRQHGDNVAALLFGGNNSSSGDGATPGGGGAPGATGGLWTGGGGGGVGIGQPNDLVACQEGAPGSEWILAKVIRHDAVAKKYQLADEDLESNKIFDLPERQVVVLTGADSRFSRGDAVYAVYPDTTSFYPAHVVQAPRKQQPSSQQQQHQHHPNAGSSSSHLVQQYVMVTFVDDSDEFGITHDKAVPLQHVMPPPYDA